MSQYPYGNDREYNLWKKIADNLYDYVVARGGVGLNAPNVNDREADLQKKAVYYTATAVDIHP